MRFTARALIFVLAGAVAVPVVIVAQATPTTARSETRIQLGDLLNADQRYWEAIRVYDQAKAGATPEQLVRASTGLVETLLQVAEFTRALEEAEYLKGLAPQAPEALALNGDALWSAGLFDEAEQVYRMCWCSTPSRAGRATGWPGASLPDICMTRRSTGRTPPSTCRPITRPSTTRSDPSIS